MFPGCLMFYSDLYVHMCTHTHTQIKTILQNIFCCIQNAFWVSYKMIIFKMLLCVFYVHICVDYMGVHGCEYVHLSLWQGLSGVLLYLPLLKFIETWSLGEPESLCFGWACWSVIFWHLPVSSPWLRLYKHMCPHLAFRELLGIQTQLLMSA